MSKPKVMFCIRYDSPRLREVTQQWTRKDMNHFIRGFRWAKRTGLYKHAHMHRCGGGVYLIAQDGTGNVMHIYTRGWK